MLTAARITPADLTAAGTGPVRSPLALWIDWPPAFRVAIRLPARLLPDFWFPSGVSLCGRRGFRTREPTSQQAALWRESAVLAGTEAILLPGAAWRLLNYGFPAPSALRVRPLPGGGFDYVQLLTEEDGDRPLAYAYRRVRPGAARHVLVRKHPKARFRTLGAQMLRNAVVLYRALGIERLTLAAGLDDGGAVWPKLGVMPRDDAEWARLARILDRRLRTMPDGPAANLAQAALHDPDRRAIWQIAALRVSPNAPKPHFGATLLAGTRWEGALRVHDPEAIGVLDTTLRAYGLPTVDDLSKLFRHAVENGVDFA